MRLRILAAAVTLPALVAFAGCSAGATPPPVAAPASGATQAQQAPPSAAASAPATTAEAAGGVKGCSEFEGKPGVVRVFCTGKATMRANVAGAESTFTTGTCEVSGGLWVFNAGVVTANWSGGSKPDYAGLVEAPGATAVITVTAGGVTNAAAGATLTLSADKKKAHAEGTSLTGKKMVVDVTCP